MLNIKTLKNSLIFLIAPLFLIACSGFFDKDNTPAPTPLTNITPEIKPHRLWTTQTGSGTGDEYLKMNPVVSASAIFTASSTGMVTAIDKINGHVIWQTNTHLPIAAGAAANNGILAVGSRQGDVWTLEQRDGKPLWKTSVPGEILAAPAIQADIVVVKTIDGFVYGLSAKDGHSVWSFKQTEPNLILRGASVPVIRDGDALVGFANGNLAKLDVQEGQLLWLQTIAIPEGAFAIQRMIDIDANPVLFEHRIYAATYQGKISSLDWASGRVLWTHDISSYTGMIADNSAVYISDAKSLVWAFNAENGFVNWRQNQLEARIVSGPATMGHYVVVGDAQGYLHWLDKTDGHFAARDFVGSAVYAAPIAENNRLYVLTSNGALIAYTIN